MNPKAKRPRKQRQVPQYEIYACQACSTLHSFTADEERPKCDRCGGEYAKVISNVENLSL